MAQMNSQLEVSETQIAARAYERWVARGCPISDGADDWFAAQAELTAPMMSKPAAKPKSTKSKAPRKAAARKQDAVASL